MIDLLRERGGAHIKVFGGGGGVIVPAEIKELHDYGVARIYSPEDGQRMGLQGMINDMVTRCDVDLVGARADVARRDRTATAEAHWRALAQLITALENGTRCRRRCSARAARRGAKQRRCRCSASPAPAAPARSRSPTSWSAASASTRATR